MAVAQTSGQDKSSKPSMAALYASVHDRLAADEQRKAKAVGRREAARKAGRHLYLAHSSAD